MTANLSWEKLSKIAKKGGLVLWRKSKKLEKLRLDAQGMIYAGTPTATGVIDEHPLDRDLPRYHCKEFIPEDKKAEAGKTKKGKR